MLNKDYKITIRFDKVDFELINNAFIEEKNKHKFDWYSYSISKYIREVLIKNCLSKKSDKIDIVGHKPGGDNNV